MSADPVRARLDHWQRQLIDLSRRNRLLNYKPTRVTTIRMVDEMPTEVFRLLFAERRAMTFRAKTEEEELELAREDEAIIDEAIIDETIEMPTVQESQQV